MDNNTFQRLRHLFDSLVALTPEQRAAAIASQDDLDDRIRHRLCELLELDAETAHLTAAKAVPSDHRFRIYQAGTRVGAYDIESLLGEGGMGSVYRARRANGDIEQQVAIKIAHRERLNAEALARFRVERQVLALLQHPNIAAMYDVGELDDGTPYLVMEYVRGQPLLAYADARQLGLRERLELFLLLCDAVAYAHRNLIVHRDIKPGNILVTADGRPKLLDFGIAKPLQQHLGAIAIEQTGTTQRCFSLRNAAPEQLRGGTIDVTCDVYGLGSVLYELLSGQPLYDFANMTFAEAERHIAENDPEPPSRRPLAADSAPAWQRRLPRDLDAIALHALRRDAQMRYPSVDALAGDVRRHVQGYPVSAGSASWRYRTRLFARRHRLAVAGGMILITVVTAGVAVWLQQYASTLAERYRAENSTRMMTDAVDQTVPFGIRRDDIGLSELLMHYSPFTLGKTGHPSTQVHLATAVAHIESSLGRPERAVELLHGVSKSLPAAPPEAREVHAATLADALIALGALDEAEDLIEQYLPGADRRGTLSQWHMLEAIATTERGDATRALELFDALLVPDARTGGLQSLEARRRRALLLVSNSRPEAAIAASFLLLADQLRPYGNEGGIDILATLRVARQVATEAGAFDMAELLSTRAMNACRSTYEDEGHYNCIDSAGLHAMTLFDAGKQQEAVIAARKAIALAHARGYGESRLAARLQFILGEILRRNSDPEAVAALREATRLGDRHSPSYSEDPMLYRAALLVAMLENGDTTGAQHELDDHDGILRARRFVIGIWPNSSVRISDPRKIEPRKSPPGIVLMLIGRIITQPLRPDDAWRSEIRQSFTDADRRSMDRITRTLFDAANAFVHETPALTLPRKRHQLWLGK